MKKYVLILFLIHLSLFSNQREQIKSEAKAREEWEIAWEVQRQIEQIEQEWERSRQKTRQKNHFAGSKWASLIGLYGGFHIAGNVITSEVYRAANSSRKLVMLLGIMLLRPIVERFIKM